MESFSWRGCVGQATKNKEKSCSFLDAIGRFLCGRSADWLKRNLWENPSFDSGHRVKLIATACRYATVRFVTFLWLALRLAFKSRLSLLCLHIVGNATENEVHASGKFCSISDTLSHSLSLSLSLSLSPRAQIREKESLPLNMTIRTSKRKFAECGHQVKVSRAHTASMQWLTQKKKFRAFSCDVELCFCERPQTRGRLGQLRVEWCNFFHFV